jgi:hypothetical protein
MPLLDFLFGTEDERKAMKDQSYLDPASVGPKTGMDPAAIEGANKRMEAARSAASRMDILDRLGYAGAAAAQSKGGIGAALGAFGGGFAQGGGEAQKQRLQQAQIRNQLAQARQREATAGAVESGGGGNKLRKDSGIWYTIDAKGNSHRLPDSYQRMFTDMERKGQSIPGYSPTGVQNPNQDVINPQGKGGGTVPWPAPVKIASWADADKLPPGTRFIDPDGNERTVPGGYPRSGPR